jgi:SPP1 gp7 family putative phage head morphogenesis protein
MKVVPHGTEYIAGYVFERGGVRIPFAKEEIIPFITPDPSNPLRGASPTQAVAIDIDTESFSAQWNRNFFYNGAPAGLVISYPETISEPEYMRLMEKWNAEHRGYGRAHKIAILTGGGKVDDISNSRRDMQFNDMRRFNRDVILAALGVPYSMLGGSEHVNRATAEAELFYFARWVLTPQLVCIRERLNEFLCPDFGDNIEVEFDDPTPENIDQMIIVAEKGYNAGILTRNEARGILGYDEDEENGNEYKPAAPVNPFGAPAPASPDNLALRGIRKSIFENEAAKLAFWKDYIGKVDEHEKVTLSAVRNYFEGLKSEALTRVRGAYIVNSDTPIIDRTKAKAAYVEAITPVLTAAMADAYRRGINIVSPPTPHRGIKIEHIFSEAAIAWLRRRIGWAADEVGEETAALLARSLKDGFASGESIAQLAERVEDVFVYCNDVRANRIARTETMMASNQGAIEGYRESGIQKAEWYLADDERTCEDCIHMADTYKALALDETEGMMPLHPNCRCVWLPIVE